ncbi:MAG TPA: hypothetical protein VK610_03595 [Rhodothermales bacterium]|nr:hypothetical protein [Rhodothermales bacterium]
MESPPPLPQAEKANQFPCRQCGADLVFQPGSDHLTCPYCGAENTIARGDVEVHELDYRAQLADLAGTTETMEVMTAKCANCAAETTLGPNETAATCAFCGAALNVQASSRRIIKPHALLPFKLTEREARDAFKKWLHGLWFAPNAVKKMGSGAGGMAGVYVPHWTYDANTTTRYTGQRGEWYYTTESYTANENGKSVTRTRQVRHTRWYGASGTVYVNFDDVLVAASTTLPAQYRPHIEPAELKTLVPYSDEYLAGFRAESYAVGLEDGFRSACDNMQPEIDRTIRNDIGGDEQRIGSKDTDYQNVTFKHILLPLWISVYQFQNKPFRFTVNARTGQVQGERPWSPVKIALAVLALLLIIAIIVAISQSQ